MSNIKETGATGTVKVGPVYLHSVTFSGGDAGGNTCEVRDGDGTAVRITLKAAQGTSASWTAGSRQGVLFSTAIHHSHSGTGSIASYEYS